ncbi:MAG: Wzt carbohydrate-binding domain-containing protein, partial [Candidatus Competibacterales bacterium]|nr:Wzt carbohydrate-binding domain-containing protein [Candidatus Competibacterales bacterium]
RIRALGGTEAVVTAYESHERDKQARAGHDGSDPWGYRSRGADLPGGAPVRICAVSLEGVRGDEIAYLESFQDLAVRIEVESLQPGVPFYVGVAITRNDRENIFGTSLHFEPGAEPLRVDGTRSLALELPGLALLSGEYRLSVYVLDDSGLQVFDMAEQICPFTVHNPGRSFGIVHLPYRWRL